MIVRCGAFLSAVLLCVLSFVSVECGLDSLLGACVCARGARRLSEKGEKKGARGGQQQWKR
jgi:hypothetical protein